LAQSIWNGRSTIFTNAEDIAAEDLEFDLAAKVGPRSLDRSKQNEEE